MKIDDLKTPNDIYNFIDENIEYGWIDINGNKHLLKPIRLNVTS